MSLHQCPVCKKEVATNSRTGGAFDLPPTLYCVHDTDVEEMEVIDRHIKVNVDE